MKNFTLTIDGKRLTIPAPSILAALRALANHKGYQSTGELIAAHTVYMSG
jgi:hypothetical protein